MQWCTKNSLFIFTVNDLFLWCSTFFPFSLAFCATDTNWFLHMKALHSGFVCHCRSLDLMSSFIGNRIDSDRDNRRKRNAIYRIWDFFCQSCVLIIFFFMWKSEVGKWFVAYNSSLGTQFTSYILQRLCKCHRRQMRINMLSLFWLNILPFYCILLIAILKTKSVFFTCNFRMFTFSCGKRNFNAKKKICCCSFAKC